jgi:nicotinamide riboside kinase
MIISFTGAQSTGKSTLLERCREEFGDKFIYFPEITRNLKRDLGVAINEAGNDITQCLIMSEHIKNNILADHYFKSESKDAIFDRCVLDGLVYTIWLWDEKKVSEWVVDYALKIFEELIANTDVIFYTDPADVLLVDDGERSVNIKFRNDVIAIFDDLIKQDTTNRVVILSGTVEERMHTIKNTLQQKGINL